MEILWERIGWIFVGIGLGCCNYKPMTGMFFLASGIVCLYVHIFRSWSDPSIEELKDELRGTCVFGGHAVWAKDTRIEDERGLYHPICFERNRAKLAEAERDKLQSALTGAQNDAKSWKHSFEMYRNAWIRELGGWTIPKSHEIDSLVLTTRRRCVNPLLGNCSVPHWLGKPTSDRKALQQTPHPRNSDCQDWKFDDAEPTLYCDVCGTELQRESCNHVRPCSKCSKEVKIEPTTTVDNT